MVVCRLCSRFLTLSILWSIQPPHCFHTNAVPPHQLPVTHHHSPASACHVLGVKGVPLLSLIRKEPHHLLHRALNHNQWLGRQRWIGTLTTLYPPPGPPKSCRHWQIIAVIFGRMCRSSLLPLKGSYHKAVDGHSFLFRKKRSQCPTACLTDATESSAYC